MTFQRQRRDLTGAPFSATLSAASSLLSFVTLSLLLSLLLSTSPTPTNFVECQFIDPPRDEGSLAGDVQNWASLIQNYILQLASDGIKREYTQVGYNGLNSFDYLQVTSNANS